MAIQAAGLRPKVVLIKQWTMFRGSCSGARKDDGRRLLPCFAVVILLKNPRMVQSGATRQGGLIHSRRIH